MKAKLKVSVIIPVYNVEKYLRQCLDSIVKQTLREIEIICINDGSTDSSLQILEEYAAKDERIIVLSQENKGVSAARNKGLKIARAPYVYFVDSDDWIDLSCLEKLYAKMLETKADICPLGIWAYDNTLKKIENNHYFDMTCFQNRPSEICRWPDIKSVIFRRWGPFFQGCRTEFLRQHNILFPDRVKYEDVMFHIKSMILAEKIAFCDENLAYYRRNRPQSIMELSKNDDMVFDAFIFLQESYDFLHQQNIYADLQSEYAKFVLGQLNFHLSRMAPQFKEDFIAKANDFCRSRNLTNCWRQYPQLYPLYEKVFGSPYKVSVIIPVYNVEKYLRQCLDSIVKQTLREIEIICINDGSTDSSLQILEEYAAKDERIIVLSQENKGVSAARNKGLENIHAPYVMFVDSDDFIAATMIQTLYDAITENSVEVAVCNIQCFEQNASDTAIRNVEEGMQVWFNRYAKTDGIYEIPQKIRQEICSVAWNKIYQTEIIRKYKLRFPPGLIQEDEYWLWAYMIHCRNYCYINQKLYYYRQRAESIMGTKDSSPKILDFLEIQRLVYEEVRKYKNILRYKVDLMNFYQDNARRILSKINPELYPNMLDKIRNYTLHCNASYKMLNFYRQMKQQMSVSKGSQNTKSTKQ